MALLKVSKNTKIHSLAGAIAQSLRENQKVDISTVGQYSLNIAIKACIVARQYIAADGKNEDIVFQPEFVHEVINSDLEDSRETTLIVIHATTIKKLD